MKKQKIIELKLEGIQPILDKLDSIQKEFNARCQIMEDKFKNIMKLINKKNGEK